MMLNLQQSISRLCRIHLILTVGICLVVWLISGPSLSASIGIGAFAMSASVIVMAWTTWRLMAQKTIALTVALIVIKYAVLLVSLYYLTQTHWLNPLGVVLGVFSFMLAALIYAALEYKQKETN